MAILLKFRFKFRFFLLFNILNSHLCAGAHIKIRMLKNCSPFFQLNSHLCAGAHIKIRMLKNCFLFFQLNSHLCAKAHIPNLTQTCVPCPGFTMVVFALTGADANSYLKGSFVSTKVFANSPLKLFLHSSGV